MNVIGNVLPIAPARCWVEIVCPLDIKRKPWVVFPENLEAPTKSKIQAAAAGKQRYHRKARCVFSLTLCAFLLLAVVFQLRKTSGSFFPVN